MKTLFVSDLDGTLLHNNESLSTYTIETINGLVQQGILFSYATARSLITSKKVTQGLNMSMPLIVYNGAFVIDNLTQEILISNYFDHTVQNIFADLFQHDIYPIVYAYIDGVEKFSFIEEKCTMGMRQFLSSRKGDIRMHPVTTLEELMRGNCFYITCIDEPWKLQPLYEKYKNDYHCVYQEDIYTHTQWLEIMPPLASKANAILQLKEFLHCDRLITFGDGLNDIDMFDISDECYAVANAVSELKTRATSTIASNDQDGVAKWLNAMH